METMQATEVYSPKNENVVDIFQCTDLLSFEDKSICLSVLHESFDLKQMLLNFSVLVKKLMREFSVSFESGHGYFNYDGAQKAIHSDSFNLSNPEKGKRVGTITYKSSTRISAKENMKLIELHKLLLPCLRQALQVSELNKLIFKDHLTKVNNRAYYDESIQRAIEQSNRTQQGLALIVLDLDDFKGINDTYGHLHGDNALIEFAQVLKKSIRSSDSVFRIGGDEFTIILQPADKLSVKKVLSRIVQGMKDSPQLQKIQMTCSFGFSHWVLGDSKESMFTRADKAMYNKKLEK